MEFQVDLNSVCEEIKAYNKMINEISEISKSVGSIAKDLKDKSWSGTATVEYEKRMKEWQSQMGKFLEDAFLVNKVLADTLNEETVDMQMLCNDFIDWLE